MPTGSREKSRPIRSVEIKVPTPDLTSCTELTFKKQIELTQKAEKDNNHPARRRGNDEILSNSTPRQGNRLEIRGKVTQGSVHQCNGACPNFSAFRHPPCSPVSSACPSAEITFESSFKTPTARGKHLTFKKLNAAIVGRSVSAWGVFRPRGAVRTYPQLCLDRGRLRTRAASACKRPLISLPPAGWFCGKRRSVLAHVLPSRRKQFSAHGQIEPASTWRCYGSRRTA